MSIDYEFTEPQTWIAERSKLRKVVILIQLVLLPLAAAAWLIEWAVSRMHPNRFQFGVYEAIPYFAIFGGLATLGVLVGGTALSWISVAVLTEMALVAIMTAIGTAVHRSSPLILLLIVITRRRFVGPAYGSLARSMTASLIAFGYAMWYFALVYVFALRTMRSEFLGGPSTKDGFRLLWPCFYFSATNLAQNASGGLMANRAFAQAVSLIEMYVGLLFVVFVIAALAARLTARPDRHAQSISQAPQVGEAPSAATYHTDPD